MTMKFMSPEAAMRAVELASNPYRPKKILDLKEEIEGEIRAGEVNASIIWGR